MGINDKILDQYETDAGILFGGQSLPIEQINRFHGTTGLLLIEIQKRCIARCAGSIRASIAANMKLIVVCLTLAAIAHATGQWPKLKDFLSVGKPVSMVQVDK